MAISSLQFSLTSDLYKMATKNSLEISKGGPRVDAIPREVSGSDDSTSEETTAPGPFPTQEEWDTLPRVPGSIPWTAWTVAFVEFVERFSYYGTSAVCKSPPDHSNRQF